ncbi:MAG: hypothetical protein JSW26_23480 [Desulfobacterales bacterium]|nr:MAG: hypothetical protein JSW26_23480 [Desulfobacterales bacterium]
MTPNGVTIAPVLPTWLIFILLGSAGGLVLVQYKRIRDRLGKTRAGYLSLLRLCAVWLIIAFALNPLLITRKSHKVIPAVAVIVDTSRSMGQPSGSDQESRLEKAKALLTKGGHPLLNSLAQKYEVKLYGLADSLTPLAPADLESLRAGGNKGDLNLALEALSQRNAVAVLLSDGKLHWPRSQSGPLPTLTIPLGDLKDYRDVLIKQIRVPALAFRDREVVIDVALKTYGYKGTNLPVLLKDSDAVLGSQTVELRNDPQEATVSFAFVPKEVGQRTLSVSIPRQVGEANGINNQFHLSMKVVPDKIRILMVSGNPSMNYRFMRAALKSDPSVDLLSFIILRTPSDTLNVPSHEQSLIPFPVETLFVKELNHFDLVLFDNFNYALFLTADHLESLRNFVKNGGSFAMVGGPNLFPEGRYGLSPVGELLPFRFAQPEFYRREPASMVRPNPQQDDHPILRFSEDSDAERSRLWHEMPALDGINLVEANKSATVLLETVHGIPWPILIVSEYGKGRVLALTTDDAWKWNMGKVARGEGNRHYLRFVHQMIRWLTKDPSLDAVQILPPEAQAIAGQTVDARVRFRGRGSSERSDSAIVHSVFDPMGARIASTFKPTPQPREYHVSFVPEAGGVYRIEIETPGGSLAEYLTVSEPLATLDAAPDHGQLQKIASATGGRYLAPGDALVSEIDAFTRKTEKEFIEQKNVPIWATPLVLAVVLCLLSAEWYFRRRWGLI